MGLSVLDPIKYGRLCADTLPRVIRTGKEFDRMVEKLEALTFKKSRSPEEKALAELLAKLIEDYDAAHYPLPEVPPHKLIQYLMKQKDLRQADLLPVFGSRSIASDVINGKREPSKTHIRKLAGFFHVSPAAFL